MKKFVLFNKYWIIALVLLGFLFWVYQSFTAAAFPDDIETGVVKRDTVVEVVSETGFVQAAQSVEMAFERGGRVTEILIQEGSFVEEGDILVKLDDAAATADLNSAYARLQAEQVRLQELLAGADTNSLAVSQSALASAETTLANAKRNLSNVTEQQNQLVADAEKTLRTAGLQAYLVSGERENSSYSFAAPTVSGVYNSDEEGVYQLELYNSGVLSGASYRVSGLEGGTESVSTVNPTAVGDRGLFVQFPSNFAKQTEWEIPIPNTRGAGYIANQNAYNALIESRNVAIAAAENAVEAAQAGVSQTQTQLTQVSGSARDERVAAQRALVRQMQANLQSVQVAYDNLTLRAPFGGLVTNTYTEVGQIVNASAPAVSLISKDQYELTVAISEVDIAEISSGDEAVVHFDAYDDNYFKAHVQRVAPNATLVDGVRVFEVTLVFDDSDQKIRDGLSADIDITTAVKEDVIAVPTRSIYEDESGKFVRVVNEDDTIKITRIQTGLRGSDGQTEVLEGLSGGETIVTFASDESLARLEN